MIAYVEPSAHYETIMAYLYFFEMQNLKADIFLDYPTKNFGFLSTKFRFFSIRQFLWKSPNYDLIIIGTADYLFGGVNKIINQFIDKTIAIIHTKKYIRDRFQKMLVYNPSCIIDTRQLFILPIHNYNKVIKSKTRKELTTKIMFIGQHKYKDIDSIEKTLSYINNCSSNSKNIVLHYFSRKEKLDIVDNNLIQHIGYSDEQMQMYIDVMDYITIFPVMDGHYHQNTMSGSIPLAFNHNKPLILDTKMCDIFGLKNVITYSDSIIEVLPKISHMSSIEYNSLVDKIYREKVNIINNSWKNLDSYIKTFSITYNYRECPMK
jgi:hypothetical protein